MGSDRATGLRTRTTDDQGGFQATFHPPRAHLHLGRVLVEATFPGDDRYWPSFGNGAITT